jgi:hypothetical protein
MELLSPAATAANPEVFSESLAVVRSPSLAWSRSDIVRQCFQLIRELHPDAAGNRLRPLLSFSATVIWLPVLYATEHSIAGDNGLKTRCCRGADSSHLLCSPHIFALVPFAQIRKDLPQIPKSLLRFNR